MDPLGIMGALANSALGAWLRDRLGQQDWQRDKRAQVYESFTGVLNKVKYVVDYDDQLNFRLGNEAQTERFAASTGLSTWSAEFTLYASDQVKSSVEEIKTWFWKWEYAVTLRPMTDEERQEWLQLGGGEDELDRNWPKVTASPLEDRYPWDELEATGRVVLHHVADTLALMREELGVSP